MHVHTIRLKPQLMSTRSATVNRTQTVQGLIHIINNLSRWIKIQAEPFCILCKASTHYYVQQCPEPVESSQIPYAFQ
jgi:hypothetical protein